ncbi:unnamed protein product [Timema podura]|uniref:Bardet-Biedl syndrome 4 n=1 Tax=Timema podura TaxID=61482 RepID=A0ABN7NI28_TIMPD|nr:unnamed protein product [Timema podura]
MLFVTAPESPILESRNWLIHIHYCRREFDVCRMYIQEELERSSRMAEYPNYIMVRGITGQAHGIVVSAPGYELTSPRFDSWLVPRGIILRHEGKIQESLEYFQTCHVLNPRSVDNIKQVARSLYLLGRHRLAVEAYLEAEAVATKPDWAIYHNLGLCLVHVGEQAKAKDNFLRALQCSRQEETYMALAKIHLLEDDIEGAIWIYKTALQCYGDSAELSTALGLLYMKTGQFQSAFEQLGSALAHDSNCPRALLAAATMMQNQRKKPSVLYIKALATGPLPVPPIPPLIKQPPLIGNKPSLASLFGLPTPSRLKPALPRPNVRPPIHEIEHYHTNQVMNLSDQSLIPTEIEMFYTEA